MASGVPERDIFRTDAERDGGCGRWLRWDQSCREWDGQIVAALEEGPALLRRQATLPEVHRGVPMKEATKGSAGAL